jgi:hypothetical protein
MKNRKQYMKPTAQLLGDLRTLTRMPGFKDLGLSDGWWLRQPNAPLCNDDNCVS